MTAHLTERTVEGVRVTSRPVTDEEVAHFHEKGWVVLRQLISPELAGAMLERIKARMGEDGLSYKDRPGFDWSSDAGTTYRGVSHDEPLFADFVQDEDMGRSMARLVGRRVGMRLLDDSMLVRTTERSQPQSYHQDRPSGWDRDHVAPWIALAEIPPQMGTMRFFSGSHAAGLFGKIGGDEEVIRRTIPAMRDAELSEQPHLMPGDATVHHHLTIHGSSANSMPLPRWAYRIRYLPEDSRYTNMPSEMVKRLDFAPYQTFDHPNFPLTRYVP
ncbi:phytanoyl-CoA dioxygenase family protein [Pseudonocardia pini]|uniref:phytanoyl-CoA dioxygenase family protein n=1 Tax=Pseudonocardia pini TaxID=2758030 RepID=UPI0015F0CBF5|nr:phytanoyl-CoA dioxygenase family protein [Pseudonocardia pini]